MKIKNVDDLPKFVLPQHYGVYSQEIRGPNTGSTNVSVLFTAMEAEGGAEIHTHDIQEHIFYVLEGELLVSDGEQELIVSAGQAMIVEPGVPHQVTGAHRGIDAKYLVVTIPPAWIE